MVKQKVNIKARIERHLRILRNVWFESKTFKQGKLGYSLTICLIFIIFIFPIYPSISSIVYTNTEIVFDRSDVDESSIIESYDLDDPEAENVPIFESVDSYISVNTILDSKRNLSWTSEVLSYEVKAWDSIPSIAEKFWVSVNTILWANNMESSRSLVVWEKIRVPSATWYLYKIKRGDVIENIAKEYNVSVEAIERQNWIKDGYIIAWKEILLPWASKKVPVVEKPKVIVQTNSKTNSKNTQTQNKKSTQNWKKTVTRRAWWWESEYVSSGGSYQLVWRKPQWNFAYWNCTRYVAQYKNVNWSGNANQWLRNARAKWHSTWSTPSLWAIVQFSWRGYNPVYWHVWIVIGIDWNNIIVSDMNFASFNKVTTRKVPINSANIDWYIYVD